MSSSNANGDSAGRATGDSETVTSVNPMFRKTDGVALAVRNTAAPASKSQVVSPMGVRPTVVISHEAACVLLLGIPGRIQVGPRRGLIGDVHSLRLRRVRTAAEPLLVERVVLIV